MFARENPIIASRRSNSPPSDYPRAWWWPRPLHVEALNRERPVERSAKSHSCLKILMVISGTDFIYIRPMFQAKILGLKHRPYQFQGISSQNMPKHMVLTYLHFGIQFPFLKITILIYGPRLYRVSDMGSTLPCSSPKKLRLPDTFFISVHGCRINQPISWSHGDVKLR